MNETFMKEKPVFSLLVSMAFPMVISMLVNSLYNIVDSYFVAKISEDAMTALSLVFPVQNFINAAGIGFGVGMNAVISFYLGAKDYEKADMATTQGLLLSAVHGVLLTIVSIEIMPFFLRLFTGSEAVAALGIQYSEAYILVLGIYYKLQTFLYLPANGIIQGMRPLIGYNYGAGEHKRVKKIFELVLVMNGLIMLGGTVICMTIPATLMGLFTHTPETIRVGETALRLISAGFLTSAISVTASGALEGLGKGMQSLVISLCRYIVIIIPAAMLLSYAIGATGVWHAFWIAEGLTAIISMLVFRHCKAY